jgi:hypothetical protein
MAAMRKISHVGNGESLVRSDVLMANTIVNNRQTPAERQKRKLRKLLKTYFLRNSVVPLLHF